ncbi:MAG: hypothetical protein SW833_03910 [Cyanobacteriota bacterium]|nr:hypothetical protein [Cyanobacteriota bacterium]
MTAPATKQKIAGYLNVLSGEQLKAVLRAWLERTDEVPLSLQQALAQPFDEEDDGSPFPEMTEEQILEDNERRWEEYQRTGRAIDHDKVVEWLDSIGTKCELPCPK